MTNYFLDTNVLLDWLLARDPFSEEAREIIRQAEDGHYNLCTSAMSLSTITYFLQRSLSRDSVKKELKALLSVLDVLPSPKIIFSQALSSSFRDLEDGYQYFTAIHEGDVDAIVTRNPSDFKHSAVPVLSPSELIKSVDAEE